MMFSATSLLAVYRCNFFKRMSKGRRKMCQFLVVLLVLMENSLMLPTLTFYIIGPFSSPLLPKSCLFYANI